MNWREAEPCDFAVLGDPVGHSLSPRMHSAAYRELGLNLTYRAIQTPLEDFEEALERLSGFLIGANCTVPLKLAAKGWAASLKGKVYAGVNTLDFRDSSGMSTDEAGFLASLPEELRAKPGRALILGAGGSAQGLGPALAERGWELFLWARREDAWRDAAPSGATLLPEPDPAACSLVVNATSAGLAGASLPVDWSQAPASCLAYDLMYGLAPTPFLADAAQAGLATQDGRRMLMEQGALSLEAWLGMEAPRTAMLEALNEHP